MKLTRSGMLVLMIGLMVHQARAYVDLSPTLAKIIRDSQTISIVEVEKLNRDKGAVILKKVRDLKGQSPDGPIRQQLAIAGTVIPRNILEWAEPGRRAVLFGSSQTALMCIGRSWFQVQSSGDGWWTLAQQRPELPLAFCGTVTRLSDGIEAMLAGKTAIITTLPHGQDDEAASFDLALHRNTLPGLLRLQRLRASLKMPDMVMAASGDPGYVVGPGPAGGEEIPELIQKLASDEPTVRAEATDDLRALGPEADSAADALAKLLEDPSPKVRMSAAAALFRVLPADVRPMAVLKNGLASQDVAMRRLAVRAAGLSGPSAAPLAGKLAQLLGDPDELTRLAALDSIATLGPSASSACDVVTRLLDDPQMRIDAADALGRMGPGARPAQKRLAQMLTSPVNDERWAAVRAMSQIGGEDAKPAVQFMIQKMHGASDLDGYNMMIYLALLGPVAKDAIPAIQSSGVRQPALKPATIWAIEPDRAFPWQNTNGRFGMGLDGDVVRYIYHSYIVELGDRLRPSAKPLAEQIMAGKAGEVPSWGYGLLAKFPDDVIPALAAGLSDSDIVQRERAAVALGYMGPAAKAAKAQVAKAMKNAPTERERKLMRWCLSEIGTAQ